MQPAVAASGSESNEVLTEILPANGFVFHEVEDYTGLLCPPKLLPIKSFTLERLENLEKRITGEAKAKRLAQQQQRAVPMWNSSAAPVLSPPSGLRG
ncbi:Cilia BBSome complex subunit 10 [Trypanosoma melophagium]|uniref:Cilia BBSome complex subunit 10 n=1 Tax=Trypanosoma melophagium TaxID=715481 RepID=UPI003519E87D|nr:Cilia BBSome complex subunit 10 [Trypanosoma melophagium]